MRERLIELLSVTNLSIEEACCCADYLLANGVIVPPCKVGDTMYSTELNFVCERRIDDVKVLVRKNVCGGYWWEMDINDLGKTVFLTREAAEAALKEGVSE